VALALAAALAPLVAGAAAPPRAAPPTHPARHYDARLFGRAWGAVLATPLRPMPGARVLIVPHHWVAGALILGPLRDLAASRAVSRVILVGPDHPNAGNDPASTSELAWSTPLGPVAVDRAVVDGLVRAGLAGRAPALLTDEHSVAGLIPALARTLPGVPVVPLLLRGDAQPGRIAALAAALAPVMDAGTVLVASVDFAHEVPVRAVPRLNGESITALRALDSRRILGWGNEHLDAPGVVALAIAVARRAGAPRFTLLADADASDFGAPASQPVTSYVAGYFR
jgi:AmmeMemoRadiSam system protein B